VTAAVDASVRRYRVEISDKELDDLRSRIVVGHCYGGALITQSGTDARDVVGLVFVAAFAPEADEKLADINARYPDIPLSAAQRTLTYSTGDGKSGTGCSSTTRRCTTRSVPTSPWSGHG
jgi:hypothetical protein